MRTESTHDPCVCPVSNLTRSQQIPLFMCASAGDATGGDSDCVITCRDELLKFKLDFLASSGVCVRRMDWWTTLQDNASQTCFDRLFGLVGRLVAAAHGTRCTPRRV